MPIRPPAHGVQFGAAGGTGVQADVSLSTHSPRGPAAVNAFLVQSQAAAVAVAALLLPVVYNFFYLVFSPGYRQKKRHDTKTVLGISKHDDALLQRLLYAPTENFDFCR